MRFTKFGKALSTGVLSMGVIFGVTSCVQSYSVGFLYVTETTTASTGNNGEITGFKIDHNTGQLSRINGLPISTGGANPVRAVLTLGSRFVYVLNRGANSSGNADCYGSGANACQGANVTEFTVGGNGILTYQQTFFTQGINPFRLVADGTGSFLLALDHDAPDNANPSSTNNCARALGSAVTTCGDVTVFKIDQTTGRLSTVQNAQVTAASGQPITYFPIPANPVDFVLSSGFLLTLTSAPTPVSYPYTGATAVWPYTYSTTNGQLTLSQNGIQPLNINQGNAIVAASGVMYVLDNEPITIPNFNGQSITSPSQMLPFTVGTGGALQAEPSGIIPDDPTLGNPIYMIEESKQHFLYVANQGNNVTGTNNPESGIAGFFITTAPAFQLSYIAGEPFGSGSGSQCIVEDPSDQYIFEANQYDSTITGRVLDPNSGLLNQMRVASTYKLDGPATWCFVDGRTS